MKKLLYLLPLLLTSLYADTYTSGRVRLTMPTTGYVDTSKRIDVKFNENFLWISTGLNAIEVSASTNNSILIGRLNALDSSTANITTILTKVAVDTSTLKSREDDFGVFRATAQPIIDGVSLSTKTFGLYSSSAIPQNDSVSRSTQSYILFKSSAEPMIDSISQSTQSYTLYVSTAQRERDRYNLFVSSTEMKFDGITMSTDASFLFQSSVTGGSAIINVSSLTSLGIITSSTGFIGGQSTFTVVRGSRFVFDDGTFYSSASYPLGGGGAASNQGVSTSSIVEELYITTNGVDANTWVLTAKRIDIGGCVVTNYSTSAVMNKANCLGGTNTGDPASTWCKIFATAKEDCSQYGVIIDSCDVVNPTPRGSHTKYRPIALFYNDSSQNIRPMTKSGRSTILPTQRTLVDIAPLTNGTRYYLDAQNELPPNCSSINGTIGNTASAGGTNLVTFEPLERLQVAFGAYGNPVTIGGSANSVLMMSYFRTVTSSRKFIYFDVDANSARFTFAINGWEDGY